MRITHIAAGAGGMYPAERARGISIWWRALIARGHDVQVVPLYTPLRIDGDRKLPISPVFYGGINVFLQQISPLCRGAPASMDRVLDNPALLKWASQVCRQHPGGEAGADDCFGALRQSWEAEKGTRETPRLPRRRATAGCLLHHQHAALRDRPDLKARFNTPVVCALQGEDGFVEMMPEPHRSHARQLMRENVRAVDLLSRPARAMPTGWRTSSMSHELRSKSSTRASKPRCTKTTARVLAARLSSAICRSSHLPRDWTFSSEAFIALARASQRDVLLRVAGKVLDRRLLEVDKDEYRLGGPVLAFSTPGRTGDQ